MTNKPIKDLPKTSQDTKGKANVLRDEELVKIVGGMAVTPRKTTNED